MISALFRRSLRAVCSRAANATSLLAVAAWFLTSWPAHAGASPLLELLGANFGTGGFNARATGPSAASAYFNPAMLPQAEQGLELGWLVFHDAISVRLDGRSADMDVPLENVNTLRDIYPVPTIWLEDGCMAGGDRLCLTDIPASPRQSDGSSDNTHVYQVVGFVNHVVEKRWTLGIYSVVPISHLLSAHSFFSDEREQYFSNSLHAELYSDRLTPMSLAFGTGLRVTDWLSLGLTFTLNLLNDAEASTYVGDSAFLDQTLLLSTKVDASIGMAPHFSVLLEPIEPIDLSLIVHTPQKFEINADSGTFLANGNSQRAARTNVHSWLPWTLALGAAYDVYRSEPHVFTVAATAMFKVWSEYEDRHGERPLPGYEWSNTAAGSLGVRYLHGERVATFLDFTYEPSPVPPQTGRTNYVDNDRYGASGGASYTLPIEDWKVKLRFGAQAQVHVLRDRHQWKIDPRSTTNNGSLVVDEWPDDATDFNGNIIPAAQGLQTNNPGWPGFGSSGTLVGGALTVGLLY